MDHKFFSQIEGEFAGRGLERKIMSIIPVQPGWRCAYWSKEEKAFSYNPIVCWALCLQYEDKDIYQTVVPMVAFMDENNLNFGDAPTNFSTIVWPEGPEPSPPKEEEAL